MITRFLTSSDTKVAKNLWGYAFETDEPFYSWYFDEVFTPENCIGIFEKDVLVCYLQLNPYSLFLHNKSFDTSYVVGVISAPEYRNKGSMKILLSNALKEMNKKNHFISILMPFDTTFYRPYGWELCYSQLKYEVPIDIIKDLSQKQGDFYRILPDDPTDDLNKVYNTHLKNNHGYAIRTKKDWKFNLKDLDFYGGYTYLLKDAQDHPVGYVQYFIKDAKFTVKEIAYSNICARKSLFGFIHSHKSQVTTIEWSAPSNDSMHLFLRDTIQPKPTNNIRLYPFMCGRMIHVKNAIEHCSFDQSINAEFSIGLRDDYAQWNDGFFAVSVKNGKAQVSSIDHQADFHCDINTFTQLFFGAISITEAIELEKVAVSNASAIDEFSKVFHRKNNYINEFF